MSKRSKQYYEPVKKKPVKSRGTGSRALDRSRRESNLKRVEKVSPRSASAKTTGRPAPRPTVRAGVMTVRIAAIVIAAASVIGGSIWALSLRGSYGTAEVAGLIVLGLLAGLGFAAALRTEEFIARVAKYTRR
jgi:hypothetical protein